MTVIGHLKKLLQVRVRSSLLCCGIPLEKATRYVGIADVITGMTFVALIFLHLNEVNDHVPPSKQTLSSCLSSLPHWLSVTILASHAVKFFLGILIYMGAVVRSRSVCRFWLVISAPCSLFAFPTNLFHFYEMVIVNQFSHEINSESEGASTADGHLKFGVGDTNLPEGMDAYIPTGENNNTIEGKYIGFGNTTFPGAQIATIEGTADALRPPPTPEVPAALLPLGLPSPLVSRSPSLYQIEMIDDVGYYDPPEDDADSNSGAGDDITDASIHSLYEPGEIAIYSSRFHGLIPSVPRLPPLRTRKLPVIPLLIVTPTTDSEPEHKISHI